MSTHAPTAFGESHIIEPAAKHTHTIILLHGRGSTGDEFADEIFDADEDSDAAIPTAANALLPGFRWVFPSSRSLWSETFQEHMPAWFDAPSLANPSFGLELQAPGIRDAVVHIHSLLDNEIARLGGDSKNVFLGGISQGGAIAMWALLGSLRNPYMLGGLIMLNTWLPFAEDVQRILCGTEELTADSKDKSTTPKQQRQATEVETFASPMLQATGQILSNEESRDAFLSTPLFSGHGIDDAYVDFKLGQQARDVFRQLRFINVQCANYSGAEQEGHWLKEPEEIDDMVDFVRRHASS
ncbi:lysophospholipase II [Microdochium nivale]|nr:lysophospholipase II [Microdochium nivale]